MPGSLLVAGTTSDAGKSVVTSGICRLLSRAGVKVAPFKAQNMSNNSMVTAAGAEIGRAQWIQSIAAGAEPEPAMNPVLLKPSSDRRSHVVVMGEPAGRLEAGEYAGGRAHLAEAAYAAYDDLRSRFDVVVCEGAGGVAEINLRAWDYVNLGLAQHDSMPTIVVADIDRGGVFAQLYGSLALLDAADQRLIAGFVINKFRGDVTLLSPGTTELERLTGRSVLGILPWQHGLWMDSEDAVAIDQRPTPRDAADALRVAVLAFPRISNFTDVDALSLEPDVDVRFVSRPEDVDAADLVILPGTRSTLGDLAWARDRGLDEAVRRFAASGRHVLGVCGGAQMLGSSIVDPVGVEGDSGVVADGLGLLDITTEFATDKALAVVEGRHDGHAVRGYVIHHGRIRRGDRSAPFLDGARSDNVHGTMWHGSLESDDFRRAVLADAARAAGRTTFAPDPSLSFEQARIDRLDVLADLIDEHIGLDPLMQLVEHGPPPGLPHIQAGVR
ncbi:cobyric acid synthase [Luteipulveratus halotolerans]|uniref:Cobyric acid synthase n=1 Tax=Luteipulveratus halotolerans TaxID=1631356 RepID=A0A0L6CEZ6_9MICO|nr:cobyric acid synthase [Luteipulveratus halotolerans]KNX36387.1 cobalamin biosynthesis protein CobQ [Luteipulveratus halotolerans]